MSVEKGSERIACQVCGRKLMPLKDGTSRRHGSHGSCAGSGFRLALWPAGQRLRHYAGAVFEIIEPVWNPGYRIDDYSVRCVSDPHGTSGVGLGERDRFHAEYVHRAGWTPEPPDLMKALEDSLREAVPS